LDTNQQALITDDQPLALTARECCIAFSARFSHDHGKRLAFNVACMR
jgi:hypothetical protein